MIPFALPTIEDDDVAAVVDTLKSGWLTMGPKTIEFENQLKLFTGAKHVACVGSCTAALHLSLLAYDIGIGDEVITSPYTFASTGNMIDQTGARPVFVDVEKSTFCMNPKNIEKAITSKTKAIIPVDFGGQPCNYTAINKIADEYDLIVIADAAHSIGANHDGKSVGTLADATCFSFYATKTLTTGEGGAVATDDEDIADRIRLLRLHGISKDAWRRYEGVGTWYYQIEECGWKYNTTDINAAIGICQLNKFSRCYHRRFEIADMYTRAFCKLGDILPHTLCNNTNMWHLYPILVEGRDEFIKHMGSRAIGTSVHFIPLHLHPYYEYTYGYRKGDFPNAEWLFEREVSLPIYPRMTDESVQYVIDAVTEWYRI